MAITGITAGPPKLTDVVNPPPGERCCYGGAFPFQVAPTTGAVLCCLRNEGYPVGDFENGSDVFLFDALDGIDPSTAIPIVRNDKYVNERGERRIAIHYPIVGGFVPLRALRPDGTPYPHAGTGFGFGEILDFPQLGSGHYSKSHKQDKMVLRNTVYQFTYDTHFFLTRDTQIYPVEEPLRASGIGKEWKLFAPSLRQAMPDGDDFLSPVVGTSLDAASGYADVGPSSD